MCGQTRLLSITGSIFSVLIFCLCIIVITQCIIHLGSNFKIVMVFKTVKGTGTGEIDLVILTQDGVPVGNNELSEELKPGQYQVSWDAQAKPDPRCDPTQQICEMWLPGNYTAEVGTLMS